MKSTLCHFLSTWLLLLLSFFLIRPTEADDFSITENANKRKLSSKTKTSPISPKIINGTNASPGRFPYTIAMFNPSNMRLICGGTLIAPDVVLTAAHCLPDPEGSPSSLLTLLIDPYNIAQASTMTPANVRLIIPHPRYRPRETGWRFDTMLLILENPTYATPVITLNWDPDMPLPQSVLTAMGWGFTVEGNRNSVPDILQEVSLDFVDNQECLDITRNNLFTYEGLLADDMMCAIGRNRGVCSGDSGGALIIPGVSAQEDIQVGVVSWGSGCAAEFYPGVYSRISNSGVQQFIRAFVCRHSVDPPPYFGCSPTQTFSPIPTIAPTAPSVSPSPSFSAATITVSILTDQSPEETGWRVVTKSDGTVMRRVDPGSYTEPDTVYTDSFDIQTGISYVFVLVDSRANGICCFNGHGEAFVYLGAQPASDSVLVYANGRSGFGTETFSPFVVSEDAIIDSVPVTQTSISLGDFPVTISIETSLTATRPQDIAWRIERLDIPNRRILVMRAPEDTYFLSGITVDIVANVPTGGLYLFAILDAGGDGFDGSFSLHLDATNSSDPTTRLFQESGTSLRGTQSYKFTARPVGFFPNLDPRRVSLEIQFDNNPGEIEWFLSMEYQDEFGGIYYDVVDFGPPDMYSADLAGTNLIRIVRFPRIPGGIVSTFNLVVTDSARNGICCEDGNGFVRLWLGLKSDGVLLASGSNDALGVDILTFMLVGLDSSAPTSSLQPSQSKTPTQYPSFSQSPTLSPGPSPRPTETMSPTGEPTRDVDVKIRIAVRIESMAQAVAWSLRGPGPLASVNLGQISSSVWVEREVLLVAPNTFQVRVYRFELTNESGRFIAASYRITTLDGRALAIGDLALGRRRIHDFSVGLDQKEPFPVTMALRIHNLPTRISWFVARVNFDGDFQTRMGDPPLPYVFPNDDVLATIMLEYGELFTWGVFGSGANGLPAHYLVLGSADGDDATAPRISTNPNVLALFTTSVWYTFVAQPQFTPPAEQSMDQSLVLQILHDNSPEEIGWTLFLEDVIFAFGPFITGAGIRNQETVNITIPLPSITTDSPMTMVVWDRRGNGISSPGGYDLFYFGKNASEVPIGSGSIANGRSETYQFTVEAKETPSPSMMPSIYSSLVPSLLPTRMQSLLPSSQLPAPSPAPVGDFPQANSAGLLRSEIPVVINVLTATTCLLLAFCY